MAEADEQDQEAELREREMMEQWDVPCMDIVWLLLESQLMWAKWAIERDKKGAAIFNIEGASRTAEMICQNHNGLCMPQRNGQ
jgi:hypothetical protein